MKTAIGKSYKDVIYGDIGGVIFSSFKYRLMLIPFVPEPRFKQQTLFRFEVAENPG